jgi:hypothetical protein
MYQALAPIHGLLAVMVVVVAAVCGLDIRRMGLLVAVMAEEEAVRGEGWPRKWGGGHVRKRRRGLRIVYSMMT